MKRRRFLYWLGASLFGAGEVLGISAFDREAAATTILSRRGGGSSSGSSNVSQGVKAIHFNSRPTSQPQNFSQHTFVIGPIVDDDVDDPTTHGKVEAKRLARQGRPPSRWLRSLDADELRMWLKSVNPPATGVNGMTYWIHLTRDHLFLAEKIAGLTIDEQAKLHSAAHAGY